jgi:hypothetical protein
MIGVELPADAHRKTMFLEPIGLNTHGFPDLPKLSWLIDWARFMRIGLAVANCRIE